MFISRLLSRKALGLAFLFAGSLAAKAQRVVSWSRTGNTLSLRLTTGYLSLQPLEDATVRVRFTKAPEAAPKSYIFPVEPAAVSYTLTATPQEVLLRLPKLTVSVDRQNSTLTFRDRAGKVLLREQPGGRSLVKSTVQGEDCFLAEQRFASPADERIYGGGQFQDGYLNIKSLPRRLTQVNTQIAIPFLTSSKGYSLLWHNYGLTDLNPADSAIPVKKETEAAHAAAQTVEVTTTEGSKKEVRKEAEFSGSFRLKTKGKYAFFLDVGQKMARGYQVAIDGKTVLQFKNFWLPPTTSWFTDLDAGDHQVTVTGEQSDLPALSYRSVENETVLRSPVADAVDYVFFCGSAGEAIASFRRLSGQAPMMPLWALGYIHCRERFHSQQELLETAEEFRKRRLPVDVIVQDWQYWGKYGWNAMQFDERYYPDPKEMVQELHDRNLKLMVSVWSKVDTASTLGSRFAAQKLFIPQTQWVDFFNPKAAAFYWQNYSERLLSLGIDSWWQDATEPENDDLKGRRVNGGALAGERVRLLYPLLVNKTVYEGSRKDAPGKRVFILTRSGFPGMQRYAAATWSGDVGNDWETLRRQLAGGLGYMASGLPWWTFDAGGFFRPGNTQYTDTAYQERFLRWFQLATFSPLQRVHGYQTNTEFWRFGATVEEQSLRYLNLRYRLLPYTYSLASEVTFQGSTLMRPMVMDFARDEKALDVQDQFLFGPSILVAPVLHPGVQERSVYLPAVKGGWFDFWTGKRISGGGTVEATAGISTIPLLVRAGSIIPMGPQQQYTTEIKDPVIEIRIYTGADGKFRLYEDDGQSYGYEKGAYATIPLNWDEQTATLTIGSRKGTFPGMLKDRKFRVVFVSEGRGAGIEESTEGQVIPYSGKSVQVRPNYR